MDELSNSARDHATENIREMTFTNDWSDWFEEKKLSLIDYQNFMQGHYAQKKAFTFVSLFSGAGIGDFGLTMAGGTCLAACEIDHHRRNVHQANIGAPIWGNIRDEKDSLIESLNGLSPDVLVATPPCQSFSTANAKRGLREDPDHATKDDRNHLFFEALYVARAIKPKIVVFENVPNFFERKIRSPDGLMTGRVIEFIKAALTDYFGHSEVVCFSKFGLPQRRVRSLAVFIRKDAFENHQQILDSMRPGFQSLKCVISSAPSNLMDAIKDLEPLDSLSMEYTKSKTDIYHQVPVTKGHRYQWIADIEKDSGKSAWENACPECGAVTTPIFAIDCVDCGSKMTNRPSIEENGTFRCIKGFKTSYKRMLPNQLAPTITTNTNSFSSDAKIHPNQNRVLSVRECALLQSIPYTFDWPEQQHFKGMHLIREMIGEAVPPLLTFQLGLYLSGIMND